MDRTDFKILMLLEENSRLSFTEISKQVNLSVPAVIERINRLTEDGIINGCTIDIDYGKLGRGLGAIILVDVRSSLYANFQKFCQSNKYIVEFYRVVGTYNTALKVRLENTAELENLVDQIKKYGTCQTSILTSTNFKNSVNTIFPD